MTIGMRIAAERKKLGLSQEALGEQLGVSRQAISKWESDGTIPEIDKLIALSRLFGVSVGWLLGVEEPAADTLSENQLRLVEEIVRQYQPKKPSRIPARLAAAAAAILFLILFASVAHLSRQISSRSNAYSQLYQEMEQLEQYVHSHTANPLLASYDFQVILPTAVADTAPAAAIMEFTATPVSWQEGDRGFLSVHLGKEEIGKVECQWNGTLLTASRLLTLEDGYSLSFTHLHADGSQQQQVLADHTLQNLQTRVWIQMDFSGSLEEPLYRNGTLQLRGDPELAVAMPSQTCDVSGITWKAMEYVLYRHAETGPEEVAVHSLLDPEWMTDPTHGAVDGMSVRVSGICFEGVTMEPGAHYEIRARAKLSSNLENEISIKSFLFQP